MLPGRKLACSWPGLLQTGLACMVPGSRAMRAVPSCRCDSLMMLMMIRRPTPPTRILQYGEGFKYPLKQPLPQLQSNLSLSLRTFSLPGLLQDTEEQQGRARPPLRKPGNVKIFIGIQVRKGWGWGGPMRAMSSVCSV